MLNYIYGSIQNLLQEGIKMYPIFIFFIVGFVIQGTKVVIDIIKYKRLYWGHVFTAGGFPSFHSGVTTSVTLLALLEYGFDSVIFAVAFAFSALFSYDAMNLRYEAGQHANYINDLRVDLEGVLTKRGKRPLKERIGHTRWEVVGGMLFGLILTFLLYYYFVVL